MASELCGSFRANKKNSEHQALLSDSLTGLEASSKARLLSTVKSLCRPKMKMSAFNKSKCLFFGGEDLKSCSNRLSRFPSSSEEHALRCGQVTVHGKGGKTRMLLVYPATWQMLMALRTKAMTDDSPVFQTVHGTAIDRIHVFRIVRAAAKRAGIRRAVSPHWPCPHMLTNGANISEVQAQLGHINNRKYLHALPSSGETTCLVPV